MPHEDRQTAKRIAALEQLLDVSRRLGATVELDRLLETIATAATAVLDCERATVFLHDPAREELYSRVATGIEGSPINEIRVPAAKGIAGEALRTGRLIAIPDAYADPRFNPAVDRESGFRTREMLACPLRDHDHTTVGVLEALNKRSGVFDAYDEELIRVLGAQAGVAVQRQMLLEAYAEKQRIQRELNIARTIQQGLLPRVPPDLHGFDIAGWNQPADETGGDSFDFLPLDDGTLAIALADATGHGIAAALIMAETRALFRAVVRQTQDVSRAVCEVNELLCLDLPDGRFNTAFFGFLSSVDRTLRFVSAGQGPMLHVVAATGEVRELDTHGPPLGVIPGIEYNATTELRLDPGDLFVILTDGFYEWEDGAGDRFGLPRMKELVRGLGARPAAEIIGEIYGAVERHSAGTAQMDDLTAVVVRGI